MIDGQEHPINTDYRACLRVIMAYEDPELADLEKQAILLENLYPERPGNIAAALEMGVKFLNGGKDGQKEGQEDLPVRLFSFDHDAGLIFSAFQQTHGIDLTRAPLHWWQFLALFLDLGAETTFCNLIGLRKRIKDGTATKEERKAAQDLGDIFAVPEPEPQLTDEEKKAEAEFLRLVAEGEAKRVRR